jgi:ribonuclease HI
MVTPLANIYQLNTHKSSISLNALIEDVFTNNTNIALVQEPPIHLGRCVGVPAPLSCLFSSAKPRTAIIHNPSLEIWQLPHLSNRDCQTAIWHNEKIKPIIIISAYWDINLPDIPPTLVKAVIEATNKKYSLLIGIDANAHHPAWGSPDTNIRGTQIETFLTNMNLHILNEGNSPTFHRKNCSTHIDITAISTSLLQSVVSWEVMETDMLSDHACLHTTLKEPTAHVRKFLNRKKTNWPHFKAVLDDLEWSLPKPININDIDNAIQLINQNLNEALSQATPTSYISGRAGRVKWWSEELRQLRRELRVAYKKLDPLQASTHTNYQQLKSSYNRAVRKAKRENWHSFINSCQSISDTSKLTRIITKPRNSPPALTVTPDGSPTWSSLESTLNIIQTHFPGSSTSPNQNFNHILDQHEDLDIDSWINQTSIQTIIHQLPLHKAPGPDNITNQMLKNLPEKVILYVTKIYKQIINLSYVPLQWCQSKAIFIPKANKPNKEEPKAYRPICLSNTMFKILEKLIQTYLEQQHIYPAKLTPRQHGFRPNKSTLTALSSLTNFIETSNYLNQQTIALFLDIQGAFDNIDPIRAIQTLAKWGTPTKIVNTLLNYYGKRSIITTIHPTNKEITIYPTKGTAQGNVLSPMLWNCIADRVGSIMDKYDIGGSLFADDTVIAARGNNTYDITTTLQQAINEIAEWANEEGLTFNVSKSHAILFYGRNQRDPPQYQPLYLNNQVITYKTDTVYLGVKFTDQLKWTDHFKMVFDRAKRDMVQISKALQKKYGPSPKLTHWIYTGIIRPKITYAAHIWCGNISNYIFDKKSRQIQRWALTKLGPIREYTPTAGLEIITKTIPLHIHLQEVSLKTAHNFLTIDFNLMTPPQGHLARWMGMLEQYIPLAFKPSDKGPKAIAPHFQNKLTSPDSDNGAEIYTDGSKIGPHCGSGFIMKWGKQTRLGMSYNGKNFTVFLSEVRAIALAVEKALTEKIPTKTINIYSDCTSAIAAIMGTKSTSKTVQHCWYLLSKLDKAYKWSITWVKAHVGISGNESADILAKRATLLNNNDPNLPTAPVHIHNAITKFSSANWTTYWNGRGDCRQTKLWFPTPNYKESKNILNLNRQDFGLIVRWLTGHCFLARHENIINNEDPTCNKCYIDEQTPWHLLKECPATRAIRSNIPPDKWTTGTILKAIKNMSYLEVLPEVPLNTQ